MSLSLWNVVLALANLFLMSLCFGSSVLTTDPRCKDIRNVINLQ